MTNPTSRAIDIKGKYLNWLTPISATIRAYAHNSKGVRPMRKKTTDIRTSHMEPTIDPFNFTDLSDLPAELAAKLYSDKTTTSAIWADILVQAKSRGFDSLNINQIEAVARRVGIDVPTAQTIRNHLNAAVALGMISKPTKQTYAVGKKASPKAEAVGLEAVVVTGEVTDMPGEPDPAAVVVDLLASL